ncbi:MAG: hypothetical protein R3A47_05560 [Polyangiales bacterium]
MLKGLNARLGSRKWCVAFHPYLPNITREAGFSVTIASVTYGNIGTLVGWLTANFSSKPWTYQEVHLAPKAV